MTIENEYNSQNNAAESMFGMGEILHEKHEAITALQNYTKFKFSTPMPPLESDEAKEQICVIDTRINRLQKKCDKEDFDFYFFYSIVLEKIMTFYHRLLGCPVIPPEKAVRIYTDKAYRESFCKDNIPEEEFITMVLNSMFFESSKQNMMKKIRELYEYSIRNVKIDPNDYRIFIKSRNDPNNFRNK